MWAVHGRSRRPPAVAAVRGRFLTRSSEGAGLCGASGLPVLVRRSLRVSGVATGHRGWLVTLLGGTGTSATSRLCSQRHVLRNVRVRALRRAWGVGAARCSGFVPRGHRRGWRFRDFAARSGCFPDAGVRSPRALSQRSACSLVLLPFALLGLPVHGSSSPPFLPTPSGLFSHITHFCILAELCE